MTTRQLANRIILLVMLAPLVVSSLGASSMQTTATGRVMRQKLPHAQRILEALTTSDYALLERESVALVQLTKDLGWMVLKTPEYRRQSDTFLRALEDMVDAAKHRDLDLAAMHYSALTMACYQCHRYVKNTRLAK